MKELEGWKSRLMVDRYAKFATEHLAVAAARIEGKRGENPTFPYVLLQRGTAEHAKSLNGLVGRAGVEPATNGLKVRCSTN